MSREAEGLKLGFERLLVGAIRFAFFCYECSLQHNHALKTHAQGAQRIWMPTLTERCVRRTLPAMNVTLAPALEEFIQRKVGQGAYASADEVIAASLAMMRTGEDEEWKAGAREKIAEGLESARAGRVHAPDDVAAWMAEQKAAWQSRGGAK